MTNSTKDNSAKTVVNSNDVQKSVNVPFDDVTVNAFATAVAKEGGTFIVTASGNLALRYPDGKIVIFEATSEIPGLVTVENIAKFNGDALELIKAFSSYIKPGEGDPAQSSNGHFNTGIDPIITPTKDTGSQVPVGDRLEHLPGQHPESYKFALNLDNLFAFYENNEISAAVGLSLTHLPGLPDEDNLRGQDPRDRLGQDDNGRNEQPIAPSFAIEDFYTGQEGDTISGDLMSNDIFPNGFIDVAVVTAPPVGNLTLNADGTFSFVPPAQFSGEVTFEYSFIDPASGITQTAIATITITPVVDDPIVIAPNFTGDEDTPVPLTGLNVTLEDDDGSETVDIQISGVPAGAGFDVGTDLGGGVWSFTPTELAVANFLPNPNLHTIYDLTITATTTEAATGDTSTDSSTFSITIEAQADAPTVNTGTTAVDEESSTVFGTDISYGLVDTDGSEVISQVELGAVPVGATVAFTAAPGAIVTPVGTTGYIITGDPAAIAATLDTFEIQPPLHSSDDFDLTVAATTTDADGSTATTNDTHTIEVTALADAPSVNTGSTPVDEDVSTIFGADITYTLVDVDGSEVVSQVEIADIPTGATMTFTPSGAAIVTPVIVGGNITGYTITGAQAEIRATLDTFEVLAPLHSNADFDLTISVTTTDAGGDTATTTDTHTIDLEAQADAPTVNTGTTAVDEDVPTVFGTDITYALVDDDGSEVISQVELGAIPVGGSIAMVASGAAVITPVIVGGNTVGYTVTGTQAEIRATLDTATITTPLHSNADFNLTVAVTTTDADGSTATTNDLHTIDIEAEADAPTVSAATTNVDEDTSTVFGTDVTYALVDADGSEVVQQVEIGAIPVGAVATFTPSGAAVVTPVIVGGNTVGYTITGTQADIRATLDTFEIQAPLHSDADFDLTIGVTTLDADGSTATTNSTHTIDLEAQADAPTVNTGTTAVDEDVPTVFGTDITYALVDGDGSEVISQVELGAIPVGGSIAMVASGAAVITPVIVGGNTVGYTITGTQAEIRATLDTATITTPLHSNADFNLTVAVTTTDADGSTATTNDLHTIDIEAEADAPTVSAATTNVDEDTSTVFGTDVTYALVDADGSEVVLQVEIGAIPVGAVAAFTPSGAAVVTPVIVGGNTVGYTITGTQADIRATLDTFEIQAPLHSDADFDLTIGVITLDADGSTATTNSTHTVQVLAVADTPAATGQNYTTDEDVAVNFAGLGGALVDIDGSETLSFQITGVDADAAFDVGTDLGGGVWSFTEAQIVAGVNYTPPPQEHGTFNMVLEAIATEAAVGGQVAVKTAVGTAPIVVTVDAVLDTPTLNNGATALNEDVVIPLGTDIDLSLVDVDGSQTMVITLTGIPAANTLNFDGALPGSVTGPIGGVYTISGTAQEAMDLLDSITVTTPAHDDTDFSVAVSVQTTETSTGDSVTVAATHDVTVSAVADAPNLSAAAVVVNEDTVVAIPVVTSLVDVDGSEQLDFVEISGIPAGSTFAFNLALPGIVTTPVAGTVRFAGTEAEIQNLLASLTIQPALHSGDDITLTATAQTSEFNPTDVGDVAVLTATSTVPINIDVVPVADQPTVSVGGVAGVYNTEEDTAIALTGLGGALIDGDGSETLTYTITGAPVGATFSSGTLGGGVWTFTAAEIAAGISYTPPLNLHGTFNMSLTSIATEGENNDQATNSLPFTVVVDAQADAPVVTANASGDEDTSINFGSQVSVTLFDNDGSETITSIAIDMSASGLVPTFVAGGATVTVVGDVYTITGSDAQIQAALDTFAVTPPLHSDDDIPFSVTANTIDADASTNSATTVGSIVVRAVADVPTSTSADANGTEDLWFNLNGLVAGTSADVDGSESISAILTNLPTGTDVRVTGVPGATVTQQGDDWVITAPDLATLNNALNTAEMRGPEHFSGTFTASLDVVSTEAATGVQVSVPTATASSNFDIIIGAVADAPIIVVTPATSGAAGFEDTPISLNINVNNLDNDGSEDLIIQISNIPAGAVLSAGVDLGGGVFELTQAQLSGLTITPPLHSNDDFQLTITAVSTENMPGIPGDGDTDSSVATLDVEVIGVADAPNVVANPVTSPEDALIPLGTAVIGSLVDLDGSETLSYVLSGLPAGVVPSAGTYIGGDWQVDAADMAGLTIPAPANFSGDYVADFAPALTIRAVSQEDDGDQAFTNVPLSITISPVIDSATPGVGIEVTEDNNISLAGIAPLAFSDNDGSETVVDYVIDFNSIVADAQISGNVVDANDFITNHIIGTFVDNLDGTITVTAGNIGGISLDAAAFLDSNIDFTIPVTTNIQDQAGAAIVTGSVASNFAIDLVGDADLPTVFAGDVSGNDGDILAINPTGNEFGGVTTDTDAGLGRGDSEEIYYIVSGVQDEPNITMAFVDSAGEVVGLNNNDGTWLLTPAELADINIKTAGGSSGTVTLTLTTVATEDDGDRATNATTFDLTVANTGGSGGVIVPLSPIVTVSAMPTNEDGAVVFNVTAVPDPLDPSPTPPSVNIIIRGVPAGAEVTGASYNPINDTWVAPAALANGGGVTVIPPENFSGIMNLTVEGVATADNLLSATTGEIASPIDVAPVADGVNISIVSPGGDEDTAIALNIGTALIDTNGTVNETIQEPIIVTVDNGATLSAGVDIGGGSYELTVAQLAGLTVTPASNFSGAVNVSVSATSIEPANGNTLTSIAAGTVTVNAVADIPSATVANSIGDEDAPITLVGLSAGLNDSDGSEVASVKISGVPNDTILSAGTNNGDGTWTVSPADLATLTLTPPPNFSGILNLTMEAFSLEMSNGNTASTALPFTVTVNPIGDDVIMTLLPQTGDEGADVPLNLNIQLGDDTGILAGENPEETVEITFSGVPVGVGFNPTSGGTVTDQGGGSWLFTGTQAQANTLAAVSTEQSGTFTINVSAVSNDNGALGAANVGTIDLTFNEISNQTLVGTGAGETLTGAAGNDTISGFAGIDILSGGSGVDTIDGGLGNDIITGGLGADILTGGANADTFVIGVGDTLGGAVDTITDFTVGDSDALDLSSLLPGYNSGTDDIADFVNLVESGGNTTVQIDQSGTGTFNTDVAIFTGVTGLDVSLMEANTNLIV